MKPPLEVVPGGPWHCPVCSPSLLVAQDGGHAPPPPPAVAWVPRSGESELFGGGAEPRASLDESRGLDLRVSTLASAGNFWAVREAWDEATLERAFWFVGVASEHWRAP